LERTLAKSRGKTKGRFKGVRDQMKNRGVVVRQGTKGWGVTRGSEEPDCEEINRKQKMEKRSKGVTLS